MVLQGDEKAKERGLQFLWCITHNCKEAQERVVSKAELFPVILQAIADADCGRNALRISLSLLTLLSLSFPSLKAELFPVILQAIADADCGRNALCISLSLFSLSFPSLKAELFPVILGYC
jgi:hypothetical protein